MSRLIARTLVVVLTAGALLAGCSTGASDGAAVASDTSRAAHDIPLDAAASAGDAALAPVPVREESRAAPAPSGTPTSAHARATTGSAHAPANAAKPATPPAAARGPRRVMLGDLDLTGIGYDRGSTTAPVVMIDFSDFSCPYCGKFSRETWPTIERDYVKTGKVFFKYVPFIAGNFPNSREATRAVECAADQGGFWRTMDLVYEAQPAWRRERDPYPLLSGIVGVAGLDTAKLRGCYASGRTDARTARASDAANALGVRVTPSFIVDERPIQGALPLAEFRKVLDAALLVRGIGRE